MNLVQPDKIIYSMFMQLLRGGRDAMFPDAWDNDPNLGLYFALRLDVNNYGYKKDGNTRVPGWERDYHRMIHVIVTVRNRCYVAVTGDAQPQVFNVEQVPVELWSNTSNHDSCWYSDGLRVFHEQVGAAWDHCYEHVPKEHRPPNRYSMGTFTTFGDGFLGNNLVNFVRIKREPIPDRNKSLHGYLDQITEVKKVGFKVVLE